MASVVILHFSPLELYPPVMNFMESVISSPSKDNWIVVSTRSDLSMGAFDIAHPRIRVYRFGRSGNSLGRWSRAAGYFTFYLMSFFVLIRFRPKAVLYFETLSSFPVFLYRRLLGFSTCIYVHYHEYISRDEYRNASGFFRWLKRAEKKMFPLVSWISHTNATRLEMFLNDEGMIDFTGGRVMPNYPPERWRVGFSKDDLSSPLRIVYAGALSLDSMYVKEFGIWVISQQGRVVWDIYSWEPEITAINFLRGLQTEWIKVCEPVVYGRLHEVLREYDVGVILYKGHIPNYIWNVPNKLYEYHINGLDVWFPDVMKGSLPLASGNSYPKIIPVAFDDLSSFDWLSAIDRSHQIFKINPWHSELSYSDLLRDIG
mgnify:CR=1 FL=1